MGILRYSDTTKWLLGKLETLAWTYLTKMPTSSYENFMTMLLGANQLINEAFWLRLLPHVSQSTTYYNEQIHESQVRAEDTVIKDLARRIKGKILHSSESFLHWEVFL